MTIEGYIFVAVFTLIFGSFGFWLAHQDQGWDSGLGVLYISLIISQVCLFWMVNHFRMYILEFFCVNKFTEHIFKISLFKTSRSFILLPRDFTSDCISSGRLSKAGVLRSGAGVLRPDPLYLLIHYLRYNKSPYLSLQISVDCKFLIVVVQYSL